MVGRDGGDEAHEQTIVVVTSGLIAAINRRGHNERAICRSTAGDRSSFFFQAEDGIRDIGVTGVQTCALPIFQPLSGEYAGRRELLEQVPFVSGYGVELGLLVDLAALAGLDALAQVDLGTRQHTHQARSEEHTSELQSRQYLVCRLLLEKKKSKQHHN